PAVRDVLPATPARAGTGPGIAEDETARVLRTADASLATRATTAGTAPTDDLHVAASAAHQDEAQSCRHKVSVRACHLRLHGAKGKNAGTWSIARLTAPPTIREREYAGEETQLSPRARKRVY